MHKNFLNNLTQKLKVQPSDKFLLAISGGADSIAMLDLFSKTNYNCVIAHCNFNLRGEDSDQDQIFVKKLAKEYNYRYFDISFDTKQYSRENGISIEMAARNLRYNWFEKIREENQCNYIATAHHQDDIVETFFINLCRGSGIRGLSGIKDINDYIIRPMLFTNRDEIKEYLSINNLNYREDISNSDVNIIRNKIRHDIIPLFNFVNSAAKKNILKTIDNLKSAEIIFEHKLDELRKEFNISESFPVKLEIGKLKKLNPIFDYIYELLKPYNFNATHIKDIIASLGSESGKTFSSESHKCLKDREFLIITPLTETKNELLKIQKDLQVLKIDEKSFLKIEKFEIDKNFKIPREENIAALDYDKLIFPLELRGWEKGDYFFPIGMKNKKKISDFFIDIKLSLIEKENAKLLISNNKIAWIVGKRLDNRFKITDKTKTVLVVTFDTIID